METIVLDPAAVATGRTELDITKWIAQAGPDWGDAQVEQYLAEAQRGQLPVDFRIPNRQIQIPLLLLSQSAATFETMRRSVQAKTALFQLERGWLSRVVNGTPWYADVVGASLKLGGSTAQALWGVDADAVLTLECLPDFYGAEITLDDMVETTNPELVRVLKQSGANAVIKGDLPARVRIVVDEDQAQAQRGLLWGFRSRRYSAATTAALTYQAEALTPLDLATVATSTITGASGGATNNTITHIGLARSWTPVLSTDLAGTGPLTHVGSYRAWARVGTPDATTPRVRFVWDVGDLLLPTENAGRPIPAAGKFFDLDLGTIRLDAAPIGTHRWRGQIQAQNGFIGNPGTIVVDRVWLQPLDEGAGVLRAQPLLGDFFGSYAARDSFGRGASLLAGSPALDVGGGTWAGSGDADDFNLAGSLKLIRTATSDSGGVGRYETASAPASPTDVVVQFDLVSQSAPAAAAKSGVIARYVDTNNWLMARVEGAPGSRTLTVAKRVATANTTLKSASVADGGVTIRLAVDRFGRFSAWATIGDPLNAQPLLSGQDNDLATGGALASGKVGFYDEQNVATANTRTYANWLAYVPSQDAVLHPSQSAELRTDGMYRENADGTGFGPIWVEGDLPRLPLSGLEARPVELFVKESRGDFDQLPDGGIDDISVQVKYRPSYLFVPAS